MLQVLGAKWRTALALLIAVTTAWMFAASRPTSPPPGAETETVCAHEIPETPGISKQQDQSDQGTPHGVAREHRSGGVPFARVLLRDLGPSGTSHRDFRSIAAGTAYPRGPPSRA
jgi:hypothetical protein